MKVPEPTSELIKTIDSASLNSTIGLVISTYNIAILLKTLVRPELEITQEVADDNVDIVRRQKSFDGPDFAVYKGGREEETKKNHRPEANKDAKFVIMNHNFPKDPEKNFAISNSTEPETDVEIAVGVENLTGIMLLKNAFSKAGNLGGFIMEIRRRSSPPGTVCEA